MPERTSFLSRTSRQRGSSALLLLALAACAAPARVNEAYTRPPAWRSEPLSWEKLERVERWLTGPAATVAPYWRVEGELVLSEGRMSFAEREISSPAATPAVSSRLELARTGFERILRDPDASAEQKRRARHGLDESGSLAALVGSARPAPSRGIADLVSRSQWGAAPAQPALLTPASPWRRITVHHSAMPDPLPMRGAIAESAAELRRIQNAHVSGRDFGDVGYHFLIDAYGHVFEGRELRWQGAHARGDNNIGNIGICLLGNFDEERPTAEALRALKTLIDELQATYRLPRGEVHPHSDYSNTQCPGRYLEPWVESQW